MARTGLSLPKLDLRSLPGPENVVRRELTNGIVLMVSENFSSPSVALYGFLPVGSLDDDPELAGLSGMTASAITRGTQQRSFQEFYESLESIGASLGVASGSHTTGFHGKSLAEDLDLLLELLADVLRNPTFPEDQVERLRGEKLTGLAIRDQNTGSRAERAFHELAYPDHPYSQPSDGYRETVEGITLGDIQDFHRRHYGPRGMVIAIAGGVEAEQALEAVSARFGDWRNDGQASSIKVPPASAPEDLRRQDVPMLGKSQCDLILGVPGPSRLDPDYIAAALGNGILGRFGMMGRIGEVVREKAGLAYYVYSTVSGGPGPGPWEVIAGVNPVNVERAIELIRGELRRFVSRGVTAEELTDNQAHFIGRLPLQLESNDGVAGSLVNIERYDLGLDYYQRYPELISSVSREQVHGIARRFLDPDRLSVAVAGPIGEGD